MKRVVSLIFLILGFNFLYLNSMIDIFGFSFEKKYSNALKMFRQSQPKIFLSIDERFPEMFSNLLNYFEKIDCDISKCAMDNRFIMNFNVYMSNLAIQLSKVELNVEANILREFGILYACFAYVVHFIEAKKDWRDARQIRNIIESIESVHQVLCDEKLWLNVLLY